MFNITEEQWKMIWNFGIPFTVYIQSQAFMHPGSFFQDINHYLHDSYPLMYEHTDSMLQLGTCLKGEGQWSEQNNPIELLDEDDWDNELPTLIYHSHGAHCNSARVEHLEMMIRKYGEHHGKELYSECIAVSDLDVKTNPTPKTWDIYAEVFTSIYTNANFQAKQYCDKIKNHPVFGKGDFNIIGISQGGLLARDMI
jgi:hypothetical protein